MTKNILIFKAEISPKSVSDFIGWVTGQLKSGMNNLDLAINSTGGTVAEGVTMMNILRALPFPVTAHNIGCVGSIALPIFAACANRKANPHSWFVFHGAGMTGSSRQDEAILRENLKSIESNNRLISEVIAENSDISTTACRELIKYETSRPSAWAHENGLVQELSEFSIPSGSNVFHLCD